MPTPDDQFVPYINSLISEIEEILKDGFYPEQNIILEDVEVKEMFKFGEQADAKIEVVVHIHLWSRKSEAEIVQGYESAFKQTIRNEIIADGHVCENQVSLNNQNLRSASN